MCPLMLLEVRKLSKRLGAHVTFVRFYTSMDSHMLRQIAGIVKCFRAVRALVTLVPAITLMNPADMNGQRYPRVKHLK